MGLVQFPAESWECHLVEEKMPEQLFFSSFYNPSLHCKLSIAEGFQIHRTPKRPRSTGFLGPWSTCLQKAFVSSCPPPREAKGTPGSDGAHVGVGHRWGGLGSGRQAIGKLTCNMEKEARGMKWTQSCTRKRVKTVMKMPVFYSSPVSRDSDKDTQCPEGKLNNGGRWWYEEMTQKGQWWETPVLFSSFLCSTC